MESHHWIIGLLVIVIILVIMALRRLVEISDLLLAVVGLTSPGKSSFDIGPFNMISKDEHSSRMVPEMTAEQAYAGCIANLGIGSVQKCQKWINKLYG